MPEKDVLRDASIAEDRVTLPAPTTGESVIADYRRTGLTLGTHPLTFLRDRLKKYRFLTADQLNQQGDGAIVRGCGIVRARQQPGTAKGVIFITPEDETGPINVIVWPDLVEKYRKQVYKSHLLAVYGQWQNQKGVRHLVSKILIDVTHMLGDLDTRSRDFC